MQRSPDDIQDELLVLRCQGGESEALHTLVSRWHPRLRRLAERRTADPEAAKDLVQDAWLAIVRGLRRLDDPSRFRVWAYRIVANKCADWVRRRAVSRQAAQALRTAVPVGNEVDAPPGLETADEIGRMRAELRGLSDDDRTILALHTLDGLSVTEIAGVLQLAPGTVKSRLFHARLRLRNALEMGNNERTGQKDS